MEGHLYSAFSATRGKVVFPLVGLIVSGGHTMLMNLKDYTHYKVIGSTVDDAAGEAFDKVAKLMKLPYPGGPVISKLAAQATSSPVVFPRPMLNQKNFDFSFSGLKTAVLNYVKNTNGDKPLSLKQKREIAKAFEDAAIDVLVQKTMRAAEKYKAKTVTLSGGVAANKKLRAHLEHAAKERKIQFSVPPFSLCTDNAAMIAIAAYFNLRGGKKPTPYNKVKADSSWELK
jgi:N6-L-threonylcarbamoyladenine synthase